MMEDCSCQSLAAFLLRRIIATRMPGVTTEDPPQSHPGPSEDAEMNDCVTGITGTCGIKAAGRGLKGRNK